MAKIDIMFGFILLWSIISTSLLIINHYNLIDRSGLSNLSPENIKRGLAQDSENKMRGRRKHAKKGNGEKRLAKSAKATDHKLQFSSKKTSRAEQQGQVQLLPEEQYDLRESNNEFPFTRSLKTFDSSNNFYIYAVNASDSLEWSELSWKQLVNKWNPSTTFDELIRLGSSLEKTEEQSISVTSKKLVIHCLPKTASTTLRDACKRLMDKKCPEVPQRHDPYGYRNPSEFYHAVKTCTEVHQFCVQGGDLTMNVIGYSGKDNDDDEERESEVKEAQDAAPMHFVHLVPFRNFNDWAASALKQIYVVDGKCDRIDEMLEQCLGYRELYMELYTKSVLAGLIGMSLNANTSNNNNPWMKHKHHIALYNYEDTSTIVTDTSNFFAIKPMPHTAKDLKGKRSAGTCPEQTLNTFHKCHDETLNNMDATRDFERELKKRKEEDRAMKHILHEHRQKEGWVPKQRRSKFAKRKVQADDEASDER